jgi:hypothetical protein
VSGVRDRAWLRALKTGHLDANVSFLLRNVDPDHLTKQKDRSNGGGRSRTKPIIEQANRYSPKESKLRLT